MSPDPVVPTPAAHPHDPLHGVTLETILNQLVQRHGWGKLGRQIPIRCFQFNPTVKSSLTFLRKTPWARQKVEHWFIVEQMRSEAYGAATQPSGSIPSKPLAPPPPLAAIQPAAALQTLWQSASPQNWGSFMSQLDRGAIPYLSHSKLVSLERCPQCYYRQYVLGEAQDSNAMNLGSLFHQAAKEFYDAFRGTNLCTPMDLASRIKTQSLSEEALASFHNALELLHANYWAGHEVVAVEEAFFMDLVPGLPPIIGIPDLVLRLDGALLVVDHKTSKSFNELDPSQLILYAEQLRRQHATDSVVGVFDEYRLVRDLVSIRKPAFRRTRVGVESTLLPELTARYQRAWRKIQSQHQEGKPVSAPDCWVCNKKSGSW